MFCQCESNVIKCKLFSSIKSTLLIALLCNYCYQKNSPSESEPVTLLSLLKRKVNNVKCILLYFSVLLWLNQTFQNIESSHTVPILYYKHEISANHATMPISFPVKYM